MSDAFLPREIIRDVLAYLPLCDLKNVRLTCKLLAEVGAENFITEVHLVFTKQSFRRMRDISLHPIISQYVEGILFEGDTLRSYENKAAWEESIQGEDWLSSMPSTTEDSEDLDGSTKAIASWGSGPKHSYSALQLEESYTAYKKLSDEQGDIEERNIDYQEIISALLRFTKLTKVRLSMAGSLEHSTGYLNRSYKATLVRSCIEPTMDERFNPPGTRQFDSLMMGVSQPERLDIKALKRLGIPLPPGLNESKQPRGLEVLHVGALSWRWFNGPAGDDMKRMLKAISTVKDLKVIFNTNREEGNPDSDETSLCEEHLRKSGGLRSFLVSAPELEKLHIEFNQSSLSTGHFPTDLIFVTGDCTWKNLRSVYFSSVRAEGHQLVNFVERHQATLQELEIESMLLSLGSSWRDTLRDIKEIGIKWDFIKIHGSLLVEGEGHPTGAQIKSFEGLESDITEEIQEYLMGNRESIPIVDSEESPDA